MIAFLSRIWHSNLTFLITCAVLVAALYVAMRLDDEYLQHYFAIRRCVSACAESSMVQVHTDEGCYCLDTTTPQPFFEPTTPPYERARALRAK